MTGRFVIPLAFLLCLALGPAASTRLGGIERASPDEDHIHHVANYAVQQVNQNPDNGPGDLVLDKVLTARKQLVAGTLYFLTLQAVEGGSGETRKFEVAVYEPFGQHTNTLKLTHYKEARKADPASSNLADPQTSTAPEAVQVVPVDETISEGAVRTVMQFNQQSNSLVPWTLKEVLVAAFIPQNNMHQLTLRVTRGEEEKDIKVNVRHADADSWVVLGTFASV